MKCQVLFSLKNNEKLFMNAANVIGALRGKVVAYLPKCSPAAKVVQMGIAPERKIKINM